MPHLIERDRRCTKRWLPAWVQLAIVILTGVCFDAYAAPSHIQWEIPHGSVPAVSPTTVRSLGIDVEVQAFHIPHPVSDVVSHMMYQYPTMSSVPAEPPQVRLSGPAQGRIATITLQPVGHTRTYATFAALSHRHDSKAALASIEGALHDEPAPPIWMPRHASLTMHVEQRHDHRTPITQQVWALPIPLHSAWKRIQQGLRRTGWSHEVSSETAGLWRHEQESLYLSVAEIEDGTAVYLQLIEGAAP